MLMAETLVPATIRHCGCDAELDGTELRVVACSQEHALAARRTVARFHEDEGGSLGLFERLFDEEAT